MVGEPLAEASAWRVCQASVIGSAHVHSGTRCQDFCGHNLVLGPNDTVVLLFAADGAGTANRSHEAAQLVCESFENHFKSLVLQGANAGDIEKAECRKWIIQAREAIRNRAAAAGGTAREYACTFLGAILGESASMFMQIGDGAIVVSCPEQPDEYDPVMWPEEAEYANMTYFVSDDDAEDHLQTSKSASSVNEVAILTDGLQRIALHIASKSAHSPFFRTFFNPLRNEEVGVSERLCEELISFLNSDQVQERTDDDKTLVMATRVNGAY